MASPNRASSCQQAHPNGRDANPSLMTARYAIYYAPADNSPLAQFGAMVLRRSALQAGERTVNPAQMPSYIDIQRWKALTQIPAGYGFHSTIKAPFELAEHASVAELLEAVGVLCSQFSTIELANLAIRNAGTSVSLAFSSGQPQSLATLAGRCVTELDNFRAPLTAVDIERRKPDQLSERQRSHLFAYGYPFVLDEFDFHMTLTSAVTATDAAFIDWLDNLFAATVPHATALFDRLAVYRQTDRQAPFLRIAEFPFGDAINR